MSEKPLSLDTERTSTDCVGEETSEKEDMLLASPFGRCQRGLIRHPRTQLKELLLATNAKLGMESNETAHASREFLMFWAPISGE